ncbi:MAG: alkaline phosphatase [Akkermansiaceae bacterium]
MIIGKNGWFSVALILWVCGAGITAADNKIVGPLVGQVTDQSVEFWMYAPKDAKVVVQISGGKTEGQVALRAVKNPAADLDGVPHKAMLPLLTPDTVYQYTVSVNGQQEKAWAGSFKTAPVAGSSGKFRFALTSCMKIGQPQGSWKVLLDQKPDFHLTVGDTHYADTTDPAVQWKHHLRYRGVPEFAEVIRQLPTYAIWDDHDYGPNDSDGTEEGKENSLQGWNQFWANPAAGTDEIPGAFYKFQRGDVDFFVIDGRYHRSPPKAADDDKKRMLGDAQFAWLLAGLKESKAKFKVIASGSTLNHSKVDGWRIYTFSRHRLFDSIKQHGISGVIYCSGDIHNSKILVNKESDRVGYPLVEVISSGIANSKKLCFVTLDFDTTQEDPVFKARIVQKDGSVSEERSWKLSELGVKK